MKDSKKGSGHHHCCGDRDCGSGLRNNYFKGKRLTPLSFQIEQDYGRDRRQLINRAIHGWGVVYGYEIKADSPELIIGPGLALDACGRELLNMGVSIKFGDVSLLDEDGKPIKKLHPPQNNDKAPVNWLLNAHYAERKMDLVRVKDPCECDCDEWDRTCETVRFSLQRTTGENCCPDCECELECGCCSHKCCEELEEDKDSTNVQAPEQGDGVDGPQAALLADEQNVTDPNKTEKATHKPFTRGGCGCLCEHLTKLEPGSHCGSLIEIDDGCETVRVDLKNGVPLACVNLEWDERCTKWTFGKNIDGCGPRRLVKRNDLLFDLVRGCDLTHISEIGWKWHRSTEMVSFYDFAAAFNFDFTDQPANRQGKKYRRRNEPEPWETRDFWVRFSRPVRAATLRPDCFAMTIMNVDDKEGSWVPNRVPILRVDGVDPDGTEKHVREALVVVDHRWLEEVFLGFTEFADSRTFVEIEVRGDFILDCNNQTIDANARGLLPTPTGNGTPGGTFLSTFEVLSKDESDDPENNDVQHDRGSQPEGAGENYPQDSDNGVAS